MSETNKRKYEIVQMHCITDGKKIEAKSIRNKEDKEVKEPIEIKGPEELERAGYIVIQAEKTTKERDGR